MAHFLWNAKKVMMGRGNSKASSYVVVGETGSASKCDIIEVNCTQGSLSAFMQYQINLSEEADHLLRQLCDPDHNLQGNAVSPENFLSAFVEEQLGEMFARRERRKAGKTKKASNAVRSAKERAKTWSEAVIATNTALEALRKLVKEASSNSKTGGGDRSRP
jgi:hypothetical protein